MHNIQIPKIRIVFDSVMRYTFGGGHNINFVLFASLKSVIVLIVFNIVMRPSRKMRNTVGQR